MTGKEESNTYKTINNETMEVLEKLRSFNQSVPDPAVLPTEADVKAAEEKLG